MNDFFTPEIEQAFDDGEFEKLVDLLEPFCNDADTVISGNAIALTAKACFNSGKYETAADYYESLANRNDARALDWFNVATSSAMAGQTDRNEKAFKTYLAMAEADIAAEKDPSPPIPYAHFYNGMALCDGGHADRALNHLNILKDIYKNLTITDGTFLHIRTIPFFENFLRFAAKVRDETIPGEGWEVWTKDLSSRIDEEGQQILKRWVSLY